MRALLAVALVVVAGCTTPGPGGPEDETTGTADATDPCSATGSTNPWVPNPSPTGCRCPWMDGCGAPAPAHDRVQLTANATSVVPGGSLTLSVLNVGSDTLSYDAAVLHCPVDAWTSTGRMVWFSCGEDYSHMRDLAPGERLEGLSWPAFECTSGSSNGYTNSCAEKEPLPPGRYSLRYGLCDVGPPCEVMAGIDVDVVAAA